MSRLFWLILLAVVLLAIFFLAFFFLVPKIPQWPSYHDFADNRTFFGIKNFFNVGSSSLFCLVALLGFISLWQKRHTFSGFFELAPFLLFFIGLFLVGLGSGYYHLEPNDFRLVFDRLAMSVVFMAMLAIAIATKIGPTHSPALGFYLLWPLLLFGMFSVSYWQKTQDLRLYGFMQYASILCTIAIITLCKTAYPPIRYFVWAFAWYALAKCFELADTQIYTATNHVISGHTLKHLASSISAYYFVLMVNVKSRLFRSDWPKE